MVVTIHTLMYSSKEKPLSVKRELTLLAMSLVEPRYGVKLLRKTDPGSFIINIIDVEFNFNVYKIANKNN